jgi:hypothetical protein
MRYKINKEIYSKKKEKKRFYTEIINISDKMKNKMRLK